jgi:glycerophosphoryl diester phosphodiesterase
MSLHEVQDYDCGSTRHPEFPHQQNEEAYKPTLREVVEAVDELAMQEGLGQIGYNIEIKSEAAWYNTYQPAPDRFAQLVLAQIDTLGLSERCILQSFDPAVLKAVRQQNNELPLALLVDNVKGLEANLSELPFTPQYYSPAMELVNKELVRSLRERNIGILVWTVNEKDDMKRMIKLGIDGIITDYPDKLIGLLEESD